MKVFRKITAVTLSIMLLTGMVMIAAQAAEPQMVISIDQTGVAGDENNRISESETLSPGEVITRKSVRDLEDGTFEITLEAVGRRFEQVTEIESPVQFDVVFVLDYSTSMDDNNKYDNMRTAAADTINKIVERNTSEYYNRVAVVKYANGASTLVNWTTDTITTQKLASTREARTNIMSGMNQAYKLLAARTGNDANRPAIIVLMTDGQPNGYYDDATLTSNTTTANQKTSGSTADANLTSVVKTIQNMAHIKALMPGNIVENGEAYNKLSIY
ncbi:MAG: VWA domain-containing protein, partial [Oscillospiraceae bacterium]|nr:VWA domain-containing protein [Oscillospiraceae bacterium]